MSHPLDDVFAELSFPRVAWLGPDDVAVRHWVRMKCRHGCRDYGHNPMCPPQAPSVEACRALFDEYERIALIHVPMDVAQPEDRFALSGKTNERLLDLERRAFLAGHPKAFVLFLDPCNLCDVCSKGDCRQRARSRPSPEALAVDLFTTARNAGLPLDVLRDYGETMNRYGMLLLD